MSTLPPDQACLAFPRLAPELAILISEKPLYQKEVLMLQVE